LFWALVFRSHHLSQTKFEIHWALVFSDINKQIHHLIPIVGTKIAGLFVYDSMKKVFHWTDQETIDS